MTDASLDAVRRTAVRRRAIRRPPDEAPRVALVWRQFLRATAPRCSDSPSSSCCSLLAYRRPLSSAPGSTTSSTSTPSSQPPGGSHWFGTTQTGFDLFALTMRGMQKSLLIGLLVARSSPPRIAATVGAFAGYFGGWRRPALMWLVDLLLVLPAFLIIAILSPTFRGSTWLIFVAAARRVSVDDHRADRARHDAVAARARVRPCGARSWACPAGGSSSATSCRTWRRC